MAQDKKKPTSSSRDIVEAALDFQRELEAFEKTKDRTVLVKALRDQFLVTRYDSASLVEKTRLKALEILFERMASMSDNMLIRTIEMLSEKGAVDLTAVMGGAKGSGPLIFQQNLGISGVLGNTKTSLDGNPIKHTGELLETLEHIAAHFRMKTIEHKEVEEDK